MKTLSIRYRDEKSTFKRCEILHLNNIPCYLARARHLIISGENRINYNVMHRFIYAVFFFNTRAKNIIFARIS